MMAAGNISVERLLSIGTEPLAARPHLAADILSAYTLGQELFRMLQQKNGFYAFESALHVFPLAATNCMSLEEWNSDSLWRGGYRDLAKGLLFFAEDIFQDQFGLSPDGVVRFSAETGRTTPFAESIGNWAKTLLENYSQETGWAFASEWQGAKGPLPPGMRLMPKTPFFIGGEYSLENLWAGDAIQGMRFKADLALQTAGLQDGSAVKLVLGKKPLNQ